MTKEKTEVRKSKISGGGLFANVLIKKGERIFFMEGDLIDINEMIDRVENNLLEGSDPLGVDDEMYIDMIERCRIINHSCDPNCFLRHKNELVALRDISKDEEITYDYSTTMDDNSKKLGELWTLKCKCGSKICRGVIDQFKTLPKDRQKYYIKNKLAPDFILRNFKKII